LDTNNVSLPSSFDHPDPYYTRLVQRYAALIPAGPNKLKFLRSALDKYQLSPLAERIGWLRAITFRRTIIEELLPLLPANQPKPAELSIIYWLYRVRYPLLFTMVLTSLVVVINAGQWFYQQSRQSQVWDLRLMRPSEQRIIPVAVPVPTKATASPVAGFAPEQIWLVERTADYEQYSNGARILINAETTTRPRSFYALYRRSTTAAIRLPFEPHLAAYYPVTKSAPVGILYHVTQSDLLPFLPDKNKALQGNISNLVEYLRQEKLYNYLIDRFGRIHRIVQDDHYANHAGNSVWGDTEAVYINLNHSFIGVAFEGHWSASMQLRPDEINEAQIYSGKMLTEILRSKYQVADENCVTHGLVSINPSNQLIGFHLDWAKGFPFTLLGLKDKYLDPPPSLVEFGFRYDISFTQALGGSLWPGIAAAEITLQKRAEKMGLTTEALRDALLRDFSRYRQWLRLSPTSRQSGSETAENPTASNPLADAP
jgi:hypothetical protein